MRVLLLKNVEEFTSEEFDMSKKEFGILKRHIGHVAEAVEAVSGEEWDYTYFDITFPDNVEVRAISGYHLKKLKG